MKKQTKGFHSLHEKKSPAIHMNINHLDGGHREKGHLPLFLFIYLGVDKIESMEFLFDKSSDKIKVLQVSPDSSPKCQNLKYALDELAGVYPDVHIHSYDIGKKEELKKELSDIGMEVVPYVVIAKGDIVMWTKGAGSVSEERKRYMTIFEGLERGNYRLEEEQTVKIWDGEGNDVVLKGTKLL